MGNCDFADSSTKETEGSKINKNYFIQEYVIGKGGYGKVWKVKNKFDHKEYAMKEMSKSTILAKKSVTSINFERELLSRLYHPFICNICYAFQDIDNLYLVVELSIGGDLRYHLFRNTKFNEYQTRFIIGCLVLALEYLHSLAIIHRDIKPENILFGKNGYVKLTDFGIARTWSPNNSTDTSGTPGYMAPEVVNSKPHGLDTDFWALGVIIYELMFGKRPYSGVRRKEYKESVNSCIVQIKEGEQPNNWSKESVDIVNKLLQRKQEKRLGCKGIEEIKNHSWFKQFNWNDVLHLKVDAPFIPITHEEFFDEGYLDSLTQNKILVDEIELQNKNLKNPLIQKLFKNFYYDKDQEREQKSKISTATSSNKKTLTTLVTSY